MDRFGNILKQRLAAAQSPSTEHPSTDTLVAFAEQSLNATQRQTVLAHLARCPLCRQSVTLAAPDGAAVAQGTARSRGLSLQLPTGIRWASLAAALAVAVGVGVLSYEHEAPRRQSAAASPQRDQHTESQPASNPKDIAQAKQPAPVISPRQDEQVHHPIFRDQSAQVRKAEQARRSVAQGSADGLLGGMVAPPPSASAKADKTEYEPKSSAVSKQERQSPGEATKPDHMFMSAPPAPRPPLSQAPTITAEAAQSAQEPKTNAASEPAPAIAKRKMMSGAAVGALQSTTLNVAPKSTHSAAIGGSQMKAKPLNAKGIVHWNISDLGQLQRESPDGTLTIVEPAPGTIVRAVAAEGIEVWAGGSQPDGSKVELQHPVLFHSSDAGETWIRINGPWQTTITRIDLAGLGNLTISTKDGTWMTVDAGKSWTKK